MKKQKLVSLVGAVSIGLCCASLFWLWYSPSPCKKADNNSLVVGTNANFPPFEFIKEGKLTGFEIELVQEIAQRIGKTVEFKDMSFDALLLAAHCDRLHIIAAAMTPTPERSQKILFTKPYVDKDPLVVITLSTYKPNSLTDLQGKEVVVNDGYTAESYMEKQPGIILKRLASPAEAFLALTSGRAVAYVSARSAVQPFFDAHPQEHFTLLELDAFDSYALAVTKCHAQLAVEIQRILDEFEQDGTLHRLKQKWHLLF